MAILSDRDIRLLCIGDIGSGVEPLITPFSEGVSGGGKISYGLTTAGYDLRLDREILVFKNTYGEIINPKKFNDEAYRKRVFETRVIEDDHFIVPAHSYILGRSHERICVPRHIKGRCVGKSTLARAGILINTTPLEPGWCTTEDTEALTPSGWRGIAEIKEGDEILTRSKTGYAVFAPVIKSWSREFKGDLIQFAGRSIDQLVTPDHRVFVWNAYQPDPFLIPASEVYGRWNFSFDRCVRITDVNTEVVEVAGKKYDAGDFAEFYGCWLGDGSAYHGNDGGYHIKLAVVTKERKRKVFRQILKKLGIEAREEERGFHWWDKDLSLWLQQHGHAKDKFVLPQFLNMSPRISSRLLSGLMSSDGNMETQTFTSSSKKLADGAQILAFRSGQAAIVRRVEGMCYDQPIVCYKVRVCNDHISPKMPPKNHGMVPYHGPVYCVTVPNHVWFMRRNGKASWTGNCGDLTIEIANINPCPAMIFVMEGIAQLEFDTLTSPPEIDYAQKNGKYQDQVGVVPPMVR